MIDTKTTSRRTSIFLGERQTSVFNRFAAKGIDLLMAVAIYFLASFLWPLLGIVCASLFVAIQDGLGAGQSPGKRIIGIRVVEDSAGLSCSYVNSLVRNVIFVICTISLTSPYLWVFFLLVGLPLVILEIYLVYSLETGVRLGDIIANTLVLEFSEEEILSF
jgi:uncharacterized RDD family membrane protein YckC